MSSILKALKKLENEKTTRKPDSFRIDAEILRGVSSQRRIFTTGVCLAALILFFCGVGATYLYMKHATVSVLSLQNSKNVFKDDLPSGIPRLPTSSTSTAHLEPQSTDPEITPAKILHSSTNSPEKQQMAPKKLPPEIVTPPVFRDSVSMLPSVAPVTPLTITAKPILKVYGIAFQDGAESVAVINGVTVSNGSFVEGVKVEEIQKDRVKFSRSGEKFEIILDKSN